MPLLHVVMASQRHHDHEVADTAKRALYLVTQNYRLRVGGGASALGIVGGMVGGASGGHWRSRVAALELVTALHAHHLFSAGPAVGEELLAMVRGVAAGGTGG